MCRFKSCLIMKDEVILAPMYNESHSSMLEALNIEDTTTAASKLFVRVELLPPNGNKSADVSEWTYNVDQDILPDWYEKDKEKYEQMVRDKVRTWMEKNFTEICGKMCVKFQEDENGAYYMLADPLFNARFGDTNNYATSNVREELLNHEWTKELMNTYGDKLVPVHLDLLSLDGFDDYGVCDGDKIAIPTFDLYRKNRKKIPTCDDWHWLATPDSTPSSYGADGVRGVRSDGDVGFRWCGYVRAVRPFFILHS